MVLVFDFDGHLYSGEKIFEFVKDWVDAHRRQFFPNITDEKYEQLMKENPDFFDLESGKQITNHIYKMADDHPELNISTEAFWNCQNEEVYNINLDGAHFVDVDFLTEIQQMFHCYIVSNSSSKHILYYMDKIGINSTLFKRIISNRFEKEDRSKQHYYIEIAKEENIDYKNLYVYGDSYDADLKPAEELGANVCLTKDSHKFKENVIKTIKDEMKKDSQLEKQLIDDYNVFVINADNDAINKRKQVLSELGVNL